jgi:hypothetical protein
MNLTASMDGGFEDDLTNDTAASNLTSLYFSVKSNNSELADCSQTILMEEIKVAFRKKSLALVDEEGRY